MYVDNNDNNVTAMNTQRYKSAFDSATKFFAILNCTLLNNNMLFYVRNALFRDRPIAII